MSKITKIAIIKESRKILREDPFQTGDASTRANYTIVSKIMQPAPSSRRVILSMTFPNLKTYYLKSGGGSDTVNLVKELYTNQSDPLLYLAQNLENSTNGYFVKLKNASLLASYNTDAKLNMMVMLDIPVKLLSEFMSSTDEESATSKFIEMMQHKYYVGTINRAKLTAANAKSIDSASGSDEKLINMFNPNWLEHWNDSALRVRAVDNWDDKHSEDAKERDAEAQSTKLLSKAERIRKEREAQNLIDSGGSKKDVAIKNIVSNAVDEANMKKNLDKGIKSQFFTRDEAIIVLKAMNTALQSKTLDNVLASLGSSTSP